MLICQSSPPASQGGLIDSFMGPLICVPVRVGGCLQWRGFCSRNLFHCQIISPGKQENFRSPRQPLICGRSALVRTRDGFQAERISPAPVSFRSSICGVTGCTCQRSSGRGVYPSNRDELKQERTRRTEPDVRYIHQSRVSRYMGAPAIFSDMKGQKGHSAFSTYCATLHHRQRVFNDEESMLGRGYKA